MASVPSWLQVKPWGFGDKSWQLDADGNVIQQTDARGQTIYAGYDALDRQLWRNTTNSPTGAYVTYTYDGAVPSGVDCTGITPGSNAVGHVTTEQFTSGPSNSMSGAYCYAYDARGELTGQLVTIPDVSYTYDPIQWQYDDGGTLTQLTYPSGMIATYDYSDQERLLEIDHTVGITTKYVVHNLTYNGAAGAAGLPDSFVMRGNEGSCAFANPVDCASLTYDNDLRLTSETITYPGDNSIDYAMTRTYDAVGNVTSVSSTLPAIGSQSGGQDNQQFCYDEQNRLVWAGDTGTNPCTSQAVTGTTLSGASYTASYSYDTSNRLTASTLTGALASDPQGSYTYDSTHYHAVDAIGSSGYEAQYDASGNMTCRTPTNASMCTGLSQTGARLTYDVEGRLIQWTSADGSTTVSYGYDGEGHRFEMQVTSGSTTTLTNYVAGLEDDQGDNAPADDYIFFLGQPFIDSHWSSSGSNSINYNVGDGLGTPTVSINVNGPFAAQLYGPYGQLRWSAGTMLTAYGFTAQHSDVTTGLDYYNARYYDPAAGTFTSADTVLPGKGFSPAGLNRYTYVADNPETVIDPSGHDQWWNDCPPNCGGPIQGNPPPGSGPPIQGNPPPGPIPGGKCGSKCPGKSGNSGGTHYSNPCGTSNSCIASSGDAILLNSTDPSDPNAYTGVGYSGIQKLIALLEHIRRNVRGLLSNDLDYIGQDVTFAVEILAGVVFFELASITPVPEWLKVLGGALGGILAGWGAGQVFGPEVADQVKDLFVNYVTGIIVQTEGDLEGIAKREGLGNDYAVTLQENDQSWWDVGHPLSNTGITVPSFVISLTFLPQVPDSGGEFQESSGGITS